MARTLTSRAGDAPRGEAGFTLIELVVVLGIVAMIAMLALPRFQAATPGLELRAAAESLGAGLRTTRSAAYRLNRETVLRLDVETGVWEGEGVAGRIPEGVEMTLDAARQEWTEESVAGVRFFPGGGATGGVIRLARGGAALEVRADWFDGRVEIADVPPE